MIMKFKNLTICLLLIGLNACSNKDPYDAKEASVESTQQDKIKIDSADNQSEIIVSKSQLSPDTSWDKAKAKVLFNHPLLSYPKPEESPEFSRPVDMDHNYSLSGQYYRIKDLLKLNNHQIFVIGNEGRDIEENDVLLNLSNDEYFKYANNLAINYIRYLKSPKIQPKQEFEKTQEFETRTQQAKLQAEKNAVDYDVELLQKALNASVKDIEFSVPDLTYKYDADSEQLFFKFSQSNNYSSSKILSEILLKIKPDLAKFIVDNLYQLKMGYVFNIKDKKPSFEGVFFYTLRTYKVSNGNPNEMMLKVTPIFKPLSFQQKSAFYSIWGSQTLEKKLESVPYQNVLISPAWSFKFGLNNYVSPEDLLKKYPPQPDHPEPEIQQEQGES